MLCGQRGAIFPGVVNTVASCLFFKGPWKLLCLDHTRTQVPRPPSPVLVFEHTASSLVPVSSLLFAASSRLTLGLAYPSHVLLSPPIFLFFITSHSPAASLLFLICTMAHASPYSQTAFSQVTRSSSSSLSL